MTVAQTFALAVQSHQAGRVAEAEALYRQILAVQPNHAETWHYLGLIAHQMGRHDLAVEFIDRAVALDPANSAAHSNLGEACRAQGRLDDAITYYRRALQLKPDFPEALSNLGMVLADRKRFEEAIAVCRRAVQLNPNRAEFHNNLGVAFAGKGLGNEATAAYREALRLKPNYAEAQNNLGNAMQADGQFDEAIAGYRLAIQSNAGYGEAYNNLGTALTAIGQYEEAVEAFHRAAQLKPNYPEALNNLGIARIRQGRPREAVAAFRHARQFQPEDAESHNQLGMVLAAHGLIEEARPEFLQAVRLKSNLASAHNNLGLTLAQQGRLEEAVAAYERALELTPDSATTQSNLGSALADLGQLDAALAAHRRAVELDANSPKAYNNLGIVLQDGGRIDEAVAAFRQAVQLRPEDAAVHSNLIYALQFQPGASAEAMENEGRRWNRIRSGRTKAPMRPFGHVRDPDRRLRVGYVSPNFRDHVVGRNLVPLLRHQDRKRFEIVCYSGVTHADRLTEEFRQYAGRWRSTLGVDDEALAEMIRRDEVDILVDLTQHLAGNRLPVFALRPAPVQVSFAGYPASAEVEGIGYRISDRYLEMENGEWQMEKESAERVMLIESFWCYDPCGMEVGVNELPALGSGGVTFGSLNNFSKINDEVLKLWARVLREEGDARLLLLSPSGGHRERAREILIGEGVEAARIEFVGWRARREYLELYHRLDVVLDPFPYGGHTTSLDALWMGVPVVSLAGERPVSRAGLSVLSNLGLREMVAFTEEDYVAMGVELARDRPRLAELRRTLRGRMEGSVLMDARRFARNIEDAYRAMWKEWCAEKAG